MIAKFIAEAHFDINATGKLGEKGMCQLIPNSTNNKWINDPRRKDPMRQAKICMEKWLAVPVKNQDIIWHSNEYTEYKNILHLNKIQS